MCVCSCVRQERESCARPLEVEEEEALRGEAAPTDGRAMRKFWGKVLGRS